MRRISALIVTALATIALSGCGATAHTTADAPQQMKAYTMEGAVIQCIAMDIDNRAGCIDSATSINW